MRLLSTSIWVLMILSSVLADTTWPPRPVAKNDHKSHITHHSLNKEEEERRRKAGSGWHPTEDSCAKGLSIPKVRVCIPVQCSVSESSRPGHHPAHFSVQVALMFLTRGYIQHHDTWELWFRDVQGMLPLSAMQVSAQHRLSPVLQPTVLGHPPH